MLNIYIGRNNLPSDKEFVFDVNAEFLSISQHMPNDDYVTYVLKEVEQATWSSETSYVDRNGLTLYNTFLSTGSKALLLAHLCKDKVVNFMEVGDNALDVMGSLPDGSVYFPLPLQYKLYTSRSDVSVNGKFITDEMDLQLELGRLI